MRYRYDADRRRLKTVELVVEEIPWLPPATQGKRALVGVRVELKEIELQRRGKQAGGK